MLSARAPTNIESWQEQNTATVYIYMYTYTIVCEIFVFNNFRMLIFHMGKFLYNRTIVLF